MPTAPEISGWHWLFVGLQTIPECWKRYETA